MLRTNLATRPFYNTRAVRAGLGVVGLLAIGLTVFNVAELWRLRRDNRQFAETVASNESQARDLRQKGQTIQQSINREQLAVITAASREANELIDRRAFSWTELLNQFQATLPPDVRITAVQPQVDEDGRMLVNIGVVSRQEEDLQAFMDALEKTGVFAGVLSRSASNEDGLLRAELEAYYGPSADSASPPSVPEQPASEPGKDEAGNRSAPPAGALR